MSASVYSQGQFTPDGAVAKSWTLSVLHDLTIASPVRYGEGEEFAIVFATVAGSPIVSFSGAYRLKDNAAPAIATGVALGFRMIDGFPFETFRYAFPT